MSEEVARLRAKRGGTRAVITKLNKEAEEFMAEASLDDKAMRRLERIQLNMMEKKKVLETLDEEILKVCEIETIEKEIEESEMYNMRIQDIDYDITTKLAALQVATITPQAIQDTPQTTQDTETGNADNVQHEESSPVIPKSSSVPPLTISSTPPSPNGTATTATRVRTKLPKITLPKFKGDVMHFKSFWDTFESSVHRNPDLNKIDKFNYLKSLLEGTASRAIDGLPITEDNYDAAIEILNKRFGQTQQLISAHMDELLKLPPCSSDKPSHLRYVYDKVSVNIRGLESLGIKSRQYGSMLIPVIMAKLPSQIRVQVARSTVNEVWDIEELLEVIRKEVEARELSEKVQTSEQKRPTSQAVANFKQNRNTPQSTANTFVASNKTDVSGKVPTCVYCSEKHYSASCEKVKDVEKRKAILKESRRCFNCLGKSHNASNCSNNKKCRKCEGKHHQSICSHSQESTTQVGKSESRTTQFSNSESSATQMISNSQTIEETPPTTTAAGACKGTVLLQTARAVATNGQRAINVRVLFDTGSQRSYITNNVKDKLQLQPIRKETLRLNTFGENKYKKHAYEVYKLCLQNRNNNDSVELTASQFPSDLYTSTYTRSLGLSASRWPRVRRL